MKRKHIKNCIKDYQTRSDEANKKFKISSTLIEAIATVLNLLPYKKVVNGKMLMFAEISGFI